jgi:predicted SAM-dependent methyltransferase
MKTIQYKNKTYPKFQDEGNASQFAIPYAKHLCQGYGVDVGCNRQEWCFPGAIGIDLNFEDGNDAYEFSYENLDYVYSSHCLEHLQDWVYALDYWTSKLKVGGVLFLYLPHYNQEYWRPWNNKKHLHIFTPEIIRDYMIDRGYINIFNSDRDMNDSFMIVGEKSA